MRRLEAHVADLRDQLKAREREVAELHVTMNRLLLALPAPAPATSTNGVAHGQAAELAVPAPSAPPETQRAPPDPPAGRSWWRRLWGQS